MILSIFILKSLDTYADVYLNDSLILSSDNMFMSHSCSVKSLLRKGDNYLYIHFYSPVHKGRADAKNDIELPGGERVYTRKAIISSMVGLGPRLVTSGIVDDVELTASDKLQIADIEFNWRDTASDTAQLFLIFFIKQPAEPIIQWSWKKYIPAISYFVNPSMFYHHHRFYRQLFYPFPMETLWIGRTTLYTFVLRIRSGKNHWTKGIYHRLQQYSASTTPPRAAAVNFILRWTEKIFIKGANLIPLNSFQPSVTRKQYLDRWQRQKTCILICCGSGEAACMRKMIFITSAIQWVLWYGRISCMPVRCIP